MQTGYKINIRGNVIPVPFNSADYSIYMTREYAEAIAIQRNGAKARRKPQVSKTIRLFGFSFYFMVRVRKLKTPSRRDAYDIAQQQSAMWG